MCEDPPGAAGRRAAAAVLPARLKRWGMNALYGVISVILVPYALARFAFDHKTRSRWRAYGRDLATRYSRRAPRASAGPCLWVHGVSVGEVKSVARLVEAIEDAWPGIEILVSVSTDTGWRVARERYRGRRVEFYPPDLSWIVDDALRALRPDLIVLVESGFWPTFLGLARERGVPVLVVNGRMSERSARRFRLVRRLVRHVLANLSEVCVQLESYAARFEELGVPRQRIHLTGNMKFDNIPIQSHGGNRDPLRATLEAGDASPLVVAGSTHPGEERALARIRRRLAAEGLDFRLLIAPRHPSRVEHVEADVRREGFAVVRRSELDGSRVVPSEAVVILDTVGELERAYTVADLVYVGGTLVRHGGQNMMEPASLGCPVVVGPHVDNFRGEVDLLLRADALALVPDEAGVEETLRRWLRRPSEAEALGRRARDAILASKGATERTLEVLRPYLDRLLARAPGLSAAGAAPPSPTHD